MRTKKKPQISPLRCAPVEMTNLFWVNCRFSIRCTALPSSTDLSSREPVTLSIFSCLRIQSAVFQTPDKAVILSEALRRSIATEGFMARSRRTPAMLVGRCSWELSGRKLQRKIKSHKLRPERSVAEGPAVSLPVRTHPLKPNPFSSSRAFPQSTWTSM